MDQDRSWSREYILSNQSANIFYRPIFYLRAAIGVWLSKEKAYGVDGDFGCIRIVSYLDLVSVFGAAAALTNNKRETYCEYTSV